VRLCEAWRVDRKVVISGGQADKLIDAGSIRRGSVLLAGIGFRKDQPGIGNKGAGWVLYFSGDGSAELGMSIRQRAKDGDEQKEQVKTFHLRYLPDRHCMDATKD
jgi:hypothetical protein